MDDPFSAYARFYDLDYAGMVDDLPILLQFAARCGSPILELACGTGRVLLPLARQGYRVTGVDNSAAMLVKARQKIAAAGLEDRIALLEQDIRRLHLEEQFNLALIVSNSFLALLTLGDQLAALQGIRRHLNPGGLLLLDIFNPDLGRLLDSDGLLTLEKIMIDPETGQRLLKLRAQVVDLGQQLIDITAIIDEVDDQGRVRRTVFPYTLRYLFRAELELLLRHAGFVVEAIYGSYDLDEFSGDSERLIAVARHAD